MRSVPEVGAVQNNLTRCEECENYDINNPLSDHTSMPHTRQLDILILDTHEISILAQLRLVEVLNGFPQFGQTHEFLPIDPHWVREHTTSINYSNRLIGTKQDFICTGRQGYLSASPTRETNNQMRTGAKIAIRTPCLDLCDVFFAQAELLVEPEDVLPDRN